MNGSWKADLEARPAPIVSALDHKVRGRLCSLSVPELIGPGDRKSIQPMAAWKGAGGTSRHPLIEARWAGRRGVRAGFRWHDGSVAT